MDEPCNEVEELRVQHKDQDMHKKLQEIAGIGKKNYNYRSR